MGVTDAPLTELRLALYASAPSIILGEEGAESLVNPILLPRDAPSRHASRKPYAWRGLLSARRSDAERARARPPDMRPPRPTCHQWPPPRFRRRLRSSRV